MFILQVVYWVIFVYGLLSLGQDIVTEFAYKKYNKNIKVYICVNDIKNNLDEVLKEIEKVKWRYKNIRINVVNCDDENRNYEHEDLGFCSIGVFSKSEFLDEIN